LTTCFELRGSTLYVENTIGIAAVDGSVVINDVATVITPNVMASNGVIHVIDAALVPASCRSPLRGPFTRIGDRREGAGTSQPAPSPRPLPHFPPD
jgi:hypothetical protein